MDENNMMEMPQEEIPAEKTIENTKNVTDEKESTVILPGGVSSNPACEKHSGLATASLILGIASLVLFCIPGFGMILGAVGLVMAIIAKVKGDKGMSLAGIITSALGVITGIILIFFLIIAGFIAREIMDNNYHYQNELEHRIELPDSFWY